jgi:hypothetical protein
VLRRLGWHYHLVHSFDLFADPERVALRVAGILGYEVSGSGDSESSASAEPAAATLF